jgi:hypothetical protein
VVAHIFSPSAREAEGQRGRGAEGQRGRGRRISEFEASLVYKVSSRTARALQRNPVPKNQNPKKKKKKHFMYMVVLCMTALCERLMPIEARRGHQIP